MEEKRYEVKFKYWDAMSNWEERTQQCSLIAKDKADAERQCIKLYSLGVDCEYEIVSVTEKEK